MYKTYLRQFHLPDESEEYNYLLGIKLTVYNTSYPFKIFADRVDSDFSFSPITILYGTNGSGKTTLLNVIASKLKMKRSSVFSSSAFFDDYVSMCKADSAAIPESSCILTSDDVFDYLINARSINSGIDRRRDELLGDFMKRKFGDDPSDPKANVFTGLDNYDEWLETHEARHRTQSKFVKSRLIKNIDMKSNGQTALSYFAQRIGENALYLLDEPENSLSLEYQLQLAEFISDSARHFGCQFVISTHSPILLSIRDSVVYDLDSEPVESRRWTELENVRRYYDFFMSRRDEFE